MTSLLGAARFPTHLRITGTATRALIGRHVGPDVVDLREQSATWQTSDAIVRCGVEVEQTGDPLEAHPVSFILSSPSLPPYFSSSLPAACPPLVLQLPPFLLRPFSEFNRSAAPPLTCLPPLPSSAPILTTPPPINILY